MRHHHAVIVGFMLVLLWVTVGGAQEVSDSVYQQEIQTHMVTPCLNVVFSEMIEESDLNEHVTVEDFLQFVGKEKLKVITQKLVQEVTKKVRGKPEKDRMVWYKMGRGLCITTGRDKFKGENPFKIEQYGEKESPPPAPSSQSFVPDRTKLWDSMKELDDMVNQQALEFEEAEQERLHAVERRQTSVPEAVRQEALRQCKKKFARIEKAGFGGGSWSLLQSCVSSELDAYLDLKQTYGESLSDK